MKLVIDDLTGKRLVISVENIAKMYNLAAVQSARLVYEDGQEFLAALEDDRELGGEG